jgi:hypothetical protein
MTRQVETSVGKYAGLGSETVQERFRGIDWRDFFSQPQYNNIINSVSIPSTVGGVGYTKGLK